MDLVAKLAVILLAMAVLYFVAQSFSEPAEATPEAPQLEEPPATPSYDAATEELAVRPREVAGTRIDNYGFRKIDLRTGPEDPADFFDELMVQMYAEGTGQSWQSAFTVCTPKGIARFMQEKRYESLSADGYIIVQRYDIDVILATILKPLDDPDEPAGDAEQLPATSTPDQA